MEHRHFQRKPANIAVQIVTDKGRTYQARLLDHSAIGIRVVVNETLPERIKVVDVLLSYADQTPAPAHRMQMFVCHKEGQELGLCLVNEGDRIDEDWQRQCNPAFSNSSKIVG